MSDRSTAPDGSIRLALLSARNDIHTVRWANALAEHGHEVFLISLHRGGEPLHPAVRTIYLPARTKLGYYANVFALRRILRDVKPDLLHAHSASGYGTLSRLSGFHPTVLSVWGIEIYLFPHASALHHRLIAQNLASADWVCSTSEDMGRHTLAVCPEVRGLTIIPFGVDGELFKREPGRRDESVITIGTIKRLKPEYGIDVLIRGFAQARRLLVAQDAHLAASLRLLIVGGGPQRPELEALAASEAVADVTQFTGAIAHADVPRCLNTLDIFAAVSRAESFGVAVVEAAMCELPAVVSNVGGLPEVVVNEETGLIVPTEDPVALGDAFSRLARDREARRRMGQAGRDFALKNYEWGENVIRMEKTYAEVLKTYRRARA